MSVSPVLNAAGRRRSPATLPGYLGGRPPRNKGIRYPADPPPVEEIVAVMRQAVVLLGAGAVASDRRVVTAVVVRAGDGLTMTVAVVGADGTMRTTHHVVGGKREQR